MIVEIKPGRGPKVVVLKTSYAGDEGCVFLTGSNGYERGATLFILNLSRRMVYLTLCTVHKYKLHCIVLCRTWAYNANCYWLLQPNAHKTPWESD